MEELGKLKEVEGVLEVGGIKKMSHRAEAEFFNSIMVRLIC